ncbi:N-6 DNA methylase [Pseudomonas protegens]|uniref:N-6 DNA methylase n=1 Tax=Pseudomonas protegens TaxID=380021 RepID=UPI0034D457F7
MNQLKLHNHAIVEFYDSITDSLDHQKLSELIDLDNADTVLRAVLPIEEMRAIGSFFTGQELSTKAVNSFKKNISEESIILDPTCGTGNLLIESSRKLSINKSLRKTLELWGKSLRGYDLHESFIEATKLRLILEAISRGATKDCSINEAFIRLSGIKKVDAMSISEDDLTDVTHALMNPPFSNWQSPKSNYWNSGNVNAAGVIFDHFLRILPQHCEISAILPDVLRSGARYGKWRAFVDSKISGEIAIIGRFNKKTNVDVFIISGNTGYYSADQKLKWTIKNLASSKLGDHFDVCIGPLVAYRDPLDGPLVPYAHSNNVPLWKTTNSIEEQRKFKGRLIKPPFIVIRRTSSPSNKFRAASAIIFEKVPVAVENHLIVVVPKVGGITECEALLETLKSPDTNLFINERIRCRHLTVGVIKEIPFTAKHND